LSGRTQPAIAATKNDATLDTAPVGPQFGPMPDRLYAAYNDERNRLHDGEQDFGRCFDKYLLTLSGGALGLSLTLLDDLHNPDGAALSWTLVMSWILLVATIIQVGAMMRLSQVAHEKYRHILDAECAMGGDRFWSRVRTEQSACSELQWVGRLNWISLATFSNGVALLLVFALANVSG
jgi:hypothetical protein